ncbi:Ankyrin repeat domain-containing protein 22-like [Scleropages formosus]|uniref:Ankyrin repeat domain 22 n=1 Tax=Scleropages formosus TaxID=113540 RepID=A0A0P7UN36_SCLFO|nr:ankyrin repeat domain-containing protein 22 isoform X1 [Scleropages formosus]KPP61067.1 Ankyrin repeat domain-containing protein 22-like [Scleropages formosus]
MGILYSEPICQAAYDDDLHQVVRLVKTDARNLNVQDELFGDTPIIAACRRGNVQTVTYLLQQNADVSIRNKKQRTCLHYAARRTFSFLDYLMIVILMPILLIGYLIMVEKTKRNANLMKLILNSNVEINAVDCKGNTALHYACQRKSDHLVSLLLDKNADISITNADNETPLDIARRLKFKNIVTILKKSD